METEDGVSTFENIVAAALPRAGTGRALGNTKEPDTQTLFARIPFEVISSELDADIKIEINSKPASAGKTLGEEELILTTEEKRF